jgi:hypothetical protein
VARTDSGLELRGGRNLRQWRVAASAGLPDISPASGLAGYVGHEATNFLNATKSIATYSTKTSGKPLFYLESANAKLVSWETSGNQHMMRFDGHLPLQARFVAPAGCELQPGAGQRAVRQGDQIDIEVNTVGKTLVIFRCAG